MAPLPLIPRRLLFGNPDRASVQVSPDGSWIAWLAPLDGVLNVWVAPRDAVLSARAMTRDKGRGIRIYQWAHTSRHILFLQDRNGDENWRLHSVELGSETPRDLTPFEGVQAQLWRVSPRSPTQVVVGLNNRSAEWHDAYRIDITTGERVLLEQNDRFGGFVVDDDLHLRLAGRTTPDGGEEAFIRGESGGWEHWATIPVEDAMTTGIIDLDRTGQSAYMIDSRGRDTAALAVCDLRTRQVRLIAADPKADVQDVIRHPTLKHVQAAAFTYERKRWEVLDPSIEPDLAYLRAVADGEVEVASRSIDDAFWIVAYLVDDGPGRFYLYERAQRKATFLFTDRKELEGQPLAHMRPALVRSRDGMEQVAYYTLPVGTDSDDDGVPDRPLATVFVPHGGPWGRDSWGFSSMHQWLANRGYAVLCANFRSSTGFGKAFVNAGDREWGGKIHEDQIDAVRWAVARGIADPARVAVLGGSFGGYSTLAGLTLSPEVFACGVDIVGPSNLVTLMESLPPYWKPQLDMFVKRVGDHRTEEGRELLLKHSPLRYVERIVRPLLIGQGANDPRVKQAESDQIVAAMREKGIPVTYVLYPDEGHGFARPENRLSFYAIAEAFLSRVLGGRHQPIGEDLRGSSIQVSVGVGEIPGLPQALAAQPGSSG